MHTKKTQELYHYRGLSKSNKVVGAVTKPHIIHILADDLGWSEVGAIVDGLGPNMNFFCEKSMTISS